MIEDYFMPEAGRLDVRPGKAKDTQQLQPLVLCIQQGKERPQSVYPAMNNPSASPVPTHLAMSSIVCWSNDST